MMKRILKIFLVVVMLFPVIVFAGGNDDDSKENDEYLYRIKNYSCVYENKSVTSDSLDSGKYISISFIGVSETMVKEFVYSFGNLNDEYEFEKTYGYMAMPTNSDFETQSNGRWLNYDNLVYPSGDNSTLVEFVSEQIDAGNGKWLSLEEIQKKADNGDLCPKQVLVTQTKKNSRYYFASCQNDSECEYHRKKVEELGFKNTKIFHFTGTSANISSKLGNEKENTAEEKLEEVKETVETYCDENSPSYDKTKCEESKIVSNATEETARRISGNIELEKVDYGQVTCATIFQETINGTVQYNSTHKLLSTTLRFVQYLAVIIALVLSVIDYIKVVPTQDKDALMKATKNATLRLGIAIVVFFVPIVLNFILGLIGFNDPTCGLL